MGYRAPTSPAAPSTQLHLLLVAAAAAALAACGGVEGPGEYSADAYNLISANGRSMNGRSMNGRSMNGTDLTGLFVVSVKLAGPTIGGKAVSTVTLKSTVFSGKLGTKAVSGSAFVNSVWTANLSDGSTLPLTVASVSPVPAPNADMTGYAVTYQTSDGSHPLCGTEADGTPVLAVPMAGFWDYGVGTRGGSFTNSNTLFTFACRHYAVGKCLELGYKPWLVVKATNLTNYMVACTRMLRADYCGDGTSYTVDGTIIDVYDRLGIQTDATPTWPVEAEWSARGALCLLPGISDRYLNLLSAVAPPCVATLLQNNCSGFSDSSTLLIDRYLR